MQNVDRKCKHCGKVVNGQPHDLAAHIRHHCPVKKAAQKGEVHLQPTTFDPISMINSLSVEVIQNDIATTERRLAALKSLLTVAKANEAPTEVSQFRFPEIPAS